MHLGTRPRPSAWLFSAALLFASGLAPASAAALGDPTSAGGGAEAATIDAVEPAEFGAGASITVRGAGFVAGDELRLDGKALERVEVAGDRITGFVPEKASKGKKLTVHRGGKAIATATTFAFVPAPKVSSAKPAFAAPGEVVTLKGKGLDKVSALALGGAELKIDAQDAQSLTFTVPPGAQTGELTVRGVGGQGGLKKPYEIFYAPVLAGVTPSAAFEGDQVLLEGEHLVGEGKGKVTYRLGSKSLKVAETGAKGVTVTIAKGAKSGPMSAEARKKRSTLAAEFKVQPTPALTKVPANVGAPGTLAVGGKNLDVVTTWRIGQVVLTPEPGGSATKVSLLVPADASGSAPLEAEAFGRPFASKKAVTVVRAPVVLALSFAPAKKGVEGVIRGEHLTAETKVKIGGKAAKIAYVDPTRLTFALAAAPSGEQQVMATTGKIAGLPLTFDGDAEGYRHSFTRLDALLGAPPADYPAVAVETDVEQSRATLPESAQELQALAAQAADPKARAGIDDRGLRIAYDLKRMLIAERALCEAMAPGKANAAANAVAGEALRAASKRSSELVGALGSLWQGLPADVVLTSGDGGLVLEQVDQNVAAALAAEAAVAKACAGKFHGDKVASDAAQTASAGLDKLYDRALLAAFGSALTRGKSWAEVEKPISARLAAFAPARAAAVKKVLQASKKGVEAGEGKRPTGKGARGDKNVEPKGKPQSNKPGKQGK